MSATEYGLDMWQMAILECFHLSLKAVPTMQGVHYESDYTIIRDYAYEKKINSIELLGLCQHLKNEFTKK